MAELRWQHSIMIVKVDIVTIMDGRAKAVIRIA